jgi:hypothetical protein
MMSPMLLPSEPSDWTRAGTVGNVSTSASKTADSGNRFFTVGEAVYLGRPASSLTAMAHEPTRRPAPWQGPVE